MKKIIKKKRIWLLTLIPLCLATNYIAEKNPFFSEWYADVVYPYISLSINQLSSLVSFSISEMLIPFAIIIAVVYFFFFVYTFIHNKTERKKTFCIFFLNIMCILSIVYFDFTVSCGINYHRLTFAQRYNYTIEPSYKSELIGLCSELANKANDCREKLGDIDTISLSDYEQMSMTAVKSYLKMKNLYPTLRTEYGKPKPLYFSEFMSKLNLTGVFFSFSFEANVNVHSPAFLIPSTMCHELSHVQGYMREDEANYIAYLVCLNSDDTFFNYSGTMLGFIHVLNALYPVDSTAYLDIYETLSYDVKSDLLQNNLYWDDFKGKTADVANSINDTYLKANDLDDGVKSYGRIVDLMLYEYRQRQEE